MMNLAVAVSSARQKNTHRISNGSILPQLQRQEMQINNLPVWTGAFVKTC